jgi:hypothetical protein
MTDATRNELLNLRAAHHRLREGLSPAPHRLSVRFADHQEQMIARYLATGRLSVVADRGAGKSFTLAFLVAVELEAGNRVVFRSGLGRSDQHNRRLWENLETFGGRDAARRAASERRLVLPSFGPDSFRGDSREFDADVRDDAWEGGYFYFVRSRRFAQAGSVPRDTIYIRPQDRPFVPEGYGPAIAFAGRTPPPAARPPLVAPAGDRPAKT